MRHLLKHLFFWLVVRPVVLVVFGLNVRHRQRLPGDGPALLVANHNSHLDTAVLMTLLPARLLHRVRPVAAADYFLANPLLAWFARNLIGILPIHRGGGEKSAGALDAIRAALDRGELVILFPEGSRGEPERLARFKSGVARLALSRPAVPVYPVFLHGLGKSLPRGAILPVPFFCDVFVGEAMYGGDQRWAGDPAAFMAGLVEAMQALATEGRFAVWE